MAECKGLTLVTLARNENGQKLLKGLARVATPRGIFLVLVIFMGAFIPMSTATGRKLWLEAFLVSMANLIRFSFNGIVLNGSAT